MREGERVHIMREGKGENSVKPWSCIAVTPWSLASRPLDHRLYQTLWQSLVQS